MLFFVGKEREQFKESQRLDYFSKTHKNLTIFFSFFMRVRFAPYDFSESDIFVAKERKQFKESKKSVHFLEIHKILTNYLIDMQNRSFVAKAENNSMSL